MKLESVDGASFDLRPVAYQFGGMTFGGDDDWDANWLVVHGDVRLADGRRWHFSYPCLTTWEAQTLGNWLRAVVAGEVEPTDLSFDTEETLEVFTEPNVALSLAARSDDSAVVRVHLSLESSPPWLDEEADHFDFFVALEVTLPALTDAVDEWERELSSFPVR